MKKFISKIKNKVNSMVIRTQMAIANSGAYLGDSKVRSFLYSHP